MNLNRFPPEDHWERTSSPERKQGRLLKAALEEDPRLKSWHWLDICREFQGGRERTEFDALIWVPNRGFVILDFKTAKPRIKKSDRKALNKVLGRVPRQADLFSQHLKRVGGELDIWAKGQAPPPVIPVVGVMDVPEATLRRWQEWWTDFGRGNPSTFVIGEEFWNKDSSEDLAAKLSEVVEEAHTGYKKTFPMSHGPETVWDGQQVETFWKVFEGKTRPKSRFPDFLDTAIESLNDKTKNSMETMWSSTLSRSLDSRLMFSGDSVTVPVPGLIYGGYVHGSAGTGKTWLALWAAINASYSGTRDVLLLTRSKELVKTLRNMTEEWLELQDESARSAIDRLQIRTPQEMLELDHPDSDQLMQWDQSSFWIDLSRKHAASFDVVLVDEAQDYVEFSDSDLTPFHYLAGLLRESESLAEMQADEVEVPTPLMVLFGDPHQTTARTAPGATWALPVGVFDDKPLLKLDINRRSTRTIVEEINVQVGQRYRFTAPDQILSGGPAEVTFRRIDRDGAKNAVLDSLKEIAELWRGNGTITLTPSQQKRIAILFDDDESRKDFLLWRDKQDPKPEYRIYNVDAFKGLESEIVILVLTSNYSDVHHRMANLYTGMSRAQGHLVVLSHEA